MSQIYYSLPERILVTFIFSRFSFSDLIRNWTQSMERRKTNENNDESLKSSIQFSKFCRRIDITLPHSEITVGGVQLCFFKNRKKRSFDLGQANICGRYAENLFRVLFGAHPQFFSKNDVFFPQYLWYGTHPFFPNMQFSPLNFGVLPIIPLKIYIHSYIIMNP